MQYWIARECLFVFLQTAWIAIWLFCNTLPAVLHRRRAYRDSEFTTLNRFSCVYSEQYTQGMSEKKQRVFELLSLTSANVWSGLVTACYANILKPSHKFGAPTSHKYRETVTIIFRVPRCTAFESMTVNKSSDKRRASSQKSSTKERKRKPAWMVERKTNFMSLWHCYSVSMNQSNSIKLHGKSVNIWR